MTDVDLYSPRLFTEMTKRMAEMQIELNEANADITRLMQERKALREQLAAVQRVVEAAMEWLESTGDECGRADARLASAAYNYRAAIAAAEEDA